MREYILAFLQTAKPKRVTTEDLETFLYKEYKNIYQEKGGYTGFARVVLMLVEEGLIKPIKAWGQNSLFPPLYNGYQAAVQEVTNKKQIQNLLTRFHPTLSLSYYMTHYDYYQTDEPLIQAISDFLYQTEKQGAEDISVNERSFELFYDEKILKQHQGKTLLNRLGITYDELACYETYEPFFYIKSRKQHRNKLHVLIIENKDTYFSLKRLFQHGMHTWFDISFNLLIYAEGKKIIHSISFMAEILEEGQDCHIHYYGDLDPSGIRIWHSTRQNTPYLCEPFVPFYRRLLQKHGQHTISQRTKQVASEEELSSFYSYFREEEVMHIQDIFEKNHYLPQEGLSRVDYHQLGSVKDGKVE
ncbi:DUF2220 domain-containing protein [Bacillus cytotoxicus]|uniref:DUF2220 domain-containing protein n=1 Tax=Bacillus cytotoxicus TaxID=580165 RepID=A0ACC6ABC0_9BACI|nr:DUF2220 domain-containing protein [Bacillus cytotoxicus]